MTRKNEKNEKNEKNHQNSITNQQYIATTTKLPGINLDNGLKHLAGNQKLLSTLLIKFKKNHSTAFSEIDSLLEQKKASDAILLAHTIKGIAANLGASDLSSIALKLETVLQENNTEENFIENIAEIKEILYQFKKELEKVITSAKILEKANTEQQANKIATNFSSSDTNEQNIDTIVIKQILVQMNQHLSENNLEVEKYLLDLKELLAENEYQQQLYELETYILNLDFEQAKANIAVIADNLNIKLNQ